MEITITIDDAQVRTMLSQTPQRINWAMRAAMNDATALVMRDMRDDPTQNPESDYVRTDNLKNSWTRKISGLGLKITGLVGSNPNTAPYNALVQDARQQAQVHRVRWGDRTVQAVARNRTADVNRMFADRLRQAIDRP